MNSAVLSLALLAPAAPPSPEPAPDVTDNVRAGLKWLAAQQKEDGTWSGPNNISRTTVTATAGLALLMEGSTPKSGTYAPHLRKTITWFEKVIQEDGRIGGPDLAEADRYVPAHAQALLFLTCVYDIDDDVE